MVADIIDSMPYKPYIALAFPYGSLNPHKPLSGNDIGKQTDVEEKKEARTKAAEKRGWPHILKFQADLEWKKHGSNERHTSCRLHRG